MTNSKMLPQIIPYQGSKRRIARYITSFVPSDSRRIVEPFAGSAAVSIAAAHSRKIDAVWLNDGHSPLIDLWRSIIETPEFLANAYESMWREQKDDPGNYFLLVRKRFNETGNPADFLYLLARCVKAAIRFNRRGEFNNTPDHRRLGASPDRMRDRIHFAHELLRDRTILTTGDYRETLDAIQHGDFVFFDPPYQGVMRNRDQRYALHISVSEFCASLSELRSREVPFAVTFDGRCGDVEYGTLLPESLGLEVHELRVGVSTQSTLLGRRDETVERLYVSPDASRQQTGFSQPSLF